MPTKTEAREDRTLLLGRLASLEGRFTQLVAELRSAVVNDVLYSGQVVLDANGVATMDFETPCGSIAASNHSNVAIVIADGPTQSSAPPNGPGVFTVGASAGETINHATREFTIYGAAGAVVTLQVFTRPQPPARGLARAAAGLGTTAATNADGQPGNPVETSVAAKLFGFNGGAGWDRIRSIAMSADSNVSGVNGILSAAFAFAYNGTGWDRFRNADGTSTGRGKYLAVTSGMGRLVIQSAATTPGTGTFLDATVSAKDWCIVVSGTAAGFSATAQFTFDGTTWNDVTPVAVAGSGGTVAAGAITTNGAYTLLNLPAKGVRINLTAIASGALTAAAIGV